MRLRLPGLLSFVLLAGCSSSTTPAEAPASAETAPAPAAGRLFVTNETAGTITVIDVAARTTLATIPVGKRPRGIRLSPDGERVFVALSGSPIAPPGVDEDTLPPADKKADGIGIVNVRTLMLERIVRGGSDPEQTAVSQDGTRLFIANEDVGEASVIAVDDGRVLGTFKVGGEPEGVDLRPDGQVVYVTSEEDNQVAVIDAIGLKLLKTFKVGARPRSTAFLPDGSRAYVSAENGGYVSVVDAQKHEEVGRITLTGEMMRPMGVVTSPDGSRLFISTGRGKRLVIVDTKTNAVLHSIEVGDRPWGVDVSRDGTLAFTANGPSNDVTIVDVATASVVARVPAGERPWGVVFVP
jgi:YVTN family beta-propeller protein